MKAADYAMGKIKHVEIAGIDGEKLRDFYRELFGWSIRQRNVSGFHYYDIETGGEPSAGIRHEPQGKPEIVLYVEVSDLDTSVAQAKALGASVRIPPMLHGELRFALVEDPEGNPIGLTQEPNGGGDA